MFLKIFIYFTSDIIAKNQSIPVIAISRLILTEFKCMLHIYRKGSYSFLSNLIKDSWNFYTCSDKSDFITIENVGK